MVRAAAGAAQDDDTVSDGTGLPPSGEDLRPTLAVSQTR